MKSRPSFETIVMLAVVCLIAAWAYALFAQHPVIAPITDERAGKKADQRGN
jgi:hypothetical protein